MITFQVKGSEVEIKPPLPADLEDLIRIECRFRPEGYQYSPKYQIGEWDGWSNLYWYRKFPVGLLDRVKMTVLLYGEKYQVIDLRRTGRRFDITTRTDLRPYQKAIVEAAIEKGGGLIQAPTGAGKSLMFIEIMARLGHNAMVIVPQIDLVHQTMQAIETATNIDPFHATTEFIKGLDGEGEIDGPFFAVATWQSIYSMIRRSKRAKKNPSIKPGEKDAAYQTRLEAHRAAEVQKKADRNALRSFLARFDTVVADECLPYAAKIVLADGSEMEIGKIVEMRLPLEVLSFNDESGEVEPKQIVSFYRIPRRHAMKKIRYRLPDGSIGEMTCTADHKVYRNGTYVMAKDLAQGDKIHALEND